MKVPLISIIVPVNKVSEQYLKKCIDSIINQSLQSIEIILVDDGSLDHCGNICETYANEDSRIRVIRKENGSLATARNAGCEAATGEWIMFVDSDDWIEPDMCKTMYETGHENKVQLVMCGLVKDHAYRSIDYNFYLEEDRIYQGHECRWLQKQLLVHNGKTANAYSKLIRRKMVIENNIFHDEFFGNGIEGLEYNLRLFDELESAVYVDQPFYHYLH